MARQIVALGGGGILREAHLSEMDRYVFGLTGRSNPKVCFLPTAGGDNDSYVARFLSNAARAGVSAQVLNLFAREVADVAAFLGEQDVVFVGGGNTANMLAVWRIHEVDKALRSAYENGTIMTGVSAGMLCWFEAAITDSFLMDHADPLYDGLGWLAGSACPHFDGEAARRPRYHELVRAGFPGGYAADDYVGLHFVDESFTKAVTTSPTASAYRITLVDDQIKEVAIPTRLLAPSP
jgi:dipeptidase E